MTDPQEFLKTIIQPALQHIDLDSEAAEQLLLGTAIQESHLTYRQQIGGPALGYFQIEPRTHDDVWNNFLKYRPELAEKVSELLTSRTADKVSELETNDKYAAAIARIIYLRAPAPLPPVNDIAKIAAYWKRYYNTALGKGRETDFIANWNKYSGDTHP